MFENLTQKLTAVFSRLGNKGRLTEADVDDAMREIRLALLEADVNFRVVRELVASIREKAVGTDARKGVSPGQQVVKIVHDELVELLGSGELSLQPNPAPPSVAMLIGLQGSGKTTTAAKLALYLRRQSQRSLLVAADLRRPAAVEQLTSLGRQIDVPFYREEKAGPSDGVKVAVNSVTRAKELNIPWVIVDTGGRLAIDDELMNELEEMKKRLEPAETLLVVDAMTGQDAINAASEFHRRVGLTGLILSKLDGDARGGAALTAHRVTGVPVKFAGIGEKPDALELFHPDRMASRILGMGDVLTLVEKAQEQVDEEEVLAFERKLRRAQFDLDDFHGQLRQVQRMGPLSSLLGMLPQAMRGRLPTADIDERRVKRLEAIISSMTDEERKRPDLINGSRRRRIALGSGVTVTEVNQLLNQFRQLQKMMRQMASSKRGGPMGLGLPKL